MPNWMGTMPAPVPGAGTDGRAAAGRSDTVITPAVLSSPCFQDTCSQSCCRWERLISPCFASSLPQSISAGRQNLCTTPELNREGRRNARGGRAIWPSGDRAAEKLQTLAFDDLWPWPYISYQQVSGPCGAPHIQRISASPCMVPLSSRATITEAGAQFTPKCFAQKQCMWNKKSKKYSLTYCSIHCWTVIGTEGTNLARKPVMRQYPIVTTKALLSENQRQQAWQCSKMA